MSASQDRTEGKTLLQHIPTFINTLLAAAIMYFGSSVDQLKQSVVKLETQNQYILQEIKSQSEKIDTAYYTSQQNQAAITELQKSK